MYSETGLNRTGSEKGGLRGYIECSQTCS